MPKTGPATGTDGRVHFAREGSDQALCGVKLTEAPDTAVRPGGWVGGKSTTCIPCTAQRMREV